MLVAQRKSISAVLSIVSVCLNVTVCLMGLETTSQVLTENFNTDTLCVLNVTVCLMGLETTSLVLTENFKADSLCGCSLAVLTRADIETSVPDKLRESIVWVSSVVWTFS